MQVNIVNDGPVTIQLESPKLTTSSNLNNEKEKAEVPGKNLSNGDQR